MSELVDRTHRAGPRFWSDSCFPSELADHPVVGVSWFEADAYARWAGKRLPTDAEWVKAASWPIAGPEGESAPRKYPWGEALDLTRVNLWAAHRDGTLAARELPAGDSVGGVRQMIGNVWEWMASSFLLENDGQQLVDPLKSLRGGAYDTYFGSRVTCQFQSADVPLARKRNIGFRCATSSCDVALQNAGMIEDPPETQIHNQLVGVPA